ncbi:OpgC domain-containing protein [Acidovorax sp.]|jgi:hypothetical protein|uniref:OpgC domain-containing protein n=1 Tax=Acidovorax sp. TaxID=1872122 RepID=UPI00391F1032
MPPAPASARSWEIDAVRGLMLLLMTVTHLPTRLTSPLGQPFGYVSAAEGFVLLSAYMAGMVYGRVAWRKSVAEMHHAFWRRALKIYACHAALLLFLFTVIAFIGIRIEQPAVVDLLNFYVKQPFTALVGGLLLLYEPPLLDILPLYVLFMLASPWVMVIAFVWGWRPVMAVSGLVWLLAQFGLSRWVYDGVSVLVPLPVPFNETGAFVMWSWQFLWMLGLWMGATRNDPNAPAFAFPRWSVLAALALALFLMGWRHLVGQIPFHPEGPYAVFNPWFDKWALGPMRMINVFVLVLLTIHYGPRLAARMPRQRWLETLGSASLPVFCAHLVLVLVVLVGLGAKYDRPWGTDLALLAASFAVLYAVARATLWLERHQKEDTTPPAMLAPGQRRPPMYPPAPAPARTAVQPAPHDQTKANPIPG